MRNYEKRITATFLTHCSPDKAYQWLFENWRGKSSDFVERGELKDERKVLEYLLYRRRDSLIELGLARYGYTPLVLKKLFVRGRTGVRCAVLANPTLFDSSLLSDSPLVDLAGVVSGARRSELEALALNPYLPDEFYEHLIERKEYFCGLTERDYQFMLHRLGDNPRLSTPYDATYMHGWSDYKYHSVFTAAWKLAATVPTTQEWAAVLNNLLRNALPPSGFDNIEEVLQRWRIDPPKKDDDKYYTPGYGFYLRSRLADLLEANQALLDLPDLALRQSFYRRFSPLEFKDWPVFLERDGEDFAFEVIRNNLNLWKSASGRLNLKAVAWGCPDPHSMMDMPNLYRSREKKLKEEHPAWFANEENQDTSELGPPTGRLLKALLKVIGKK